MDTRCAPAVLFWNPPNAQLDADWSKSDNWYDQDAGQQRPANQAPPGVNDTVTFKGNDAGKSKNDLCKIDCDSMQLMGLAKVKNFIIETGYTETIIVSAKDANTPGKVEVTGSLQMEAGGAGGLLGDPRTVNGVKECPAFLVHGSLSWKSATLSDVDLINNSPNGKIEGTGTKILETGATFSNYTNRTTKWTQGNIELRNKAQILNIGNFEISAQASVITESEETAFKSSGTLTKIGGLITTTIQAEFFNAGTFVIQSGSIKFTFLARQGQAGAPTMPPPRTTLHPGAELNVLDIADGYRVYDGVFEGTGTVTGHLNNWGGEVWPSLDGLPGTLTVTKDYSQDDDATPGKFCVVINAAGTCSKLAVEGQASLGGQLVVWNGDYHGTASVMTIMTYDSLNNDFDSAWFAQPFWPDGTGQMWYFDPEAGQKAYKLFAMPLI